MNFLSMKYFLAVAKERSFTKAAAKLHITQQTLSAHICSVEKELGCPLFLRTSPLEPTYAGEVFCRYAGQFETLRLSLERELADIRSEEKGVLRVGIAHTRGHVIMPELICRHRQEHPKMEIQVVEDVNDGLCRKLRDQELDLIIANFPDDMPEVASQPFYDERIVLLVSNGLLRQLYGDKAEELAQYVKTSGDLSVLSQCPFLLCGPEDIAGKIGTHLLSCAGFIPHVSVQSGNIETLLELCVEGAGACFCPDLFMHKTLNREKRSGLQVISFGDAARYRIKFGWLKQPYCWSAVSAFIETASHFNPKDLPGCP